MKMLASLPAPTCSSQTVGSGQANLKPEQQNRQFWKPTLLRGKVESMAAAAALMLMLMQLVEVVVEVEVVVVVVVVAVAAAAAAAAAVVVVVVVALRHHRLGSSHLQYSQMDQRLLGFFRL